MTYNLKDLKEKHRKKKGTIRLTLHNNKEVTCDVLSIFTVKDKEYIAVLPKKSETVLLYRYEEKNNTPVLTNIEDSREYTLASHRFMKLNQ
ncbi:DUF1292 domain-containing protein [Proteinivorax hydrogeniformans]|uniref:DUF1292 domain-containing protein n=1 Tax=Proteinivorax hydrogeniformans TaxID=1826727 RepID=A0AAU8HTT2_9FIRM